jgi:hypothetical protein
MGFLMPKTPTMPTIPAPKPLPEPPSYDDEERKKEIEERRAQVRRNRKGRKQTILTGAEGLEDDSLLVKKKKLGG